MNKNLLIVCFSTIFVGFSIFSYLAKRSDQQASPDWILSGIWQINISNSNSFVVNAGSNDLFMQSLQPGASKQQHLLDYVGKNKCRAKTPECSLVMLVGANLLLDAGEYDSGLKGGVTAYDMIRKSGACGIMPEITVLRFKLHQLDEFTKNKAEWRAQGALGIVRDKGGFMSSLRSASCEKLRAEKPELFDAYASVVAQLMQRAGGSFPDAASKIENALK
jgi:hypothetical protein